MLPDVNLDTERYEGIMKNAKDKIAAYYPNWTDYNNHDPGITLLEMFSGLKEIQQYAMNQIGEDHYTKYLKLMGVKKKGRQPSGLTLHIKTKENGWLPKGTRFYGGRVCFETEREETLLKGDISLCIVKSDGKHMVYRKEQWNANSRFELFPFTEQTDAGNEVYIGFAKPWVPNAIQTIFIRVYKDYPVKRNKIDNNTWIPIANLSYEYFSSQSKWEPLEVVNDETHGFLEDGNLSAYARRNMQEVKIHGEIGYYIRIRLVRDFYDVAPKWTWLGMNAVRVKQQETLSESCQVEAAHIKQTEDSFIVRTSLFLAKHGSQTLYFRFGDYEYEVSHYEKREDEEGRIEYEIPKKHYPNVKPDAVRIVCHHGEFSDKSGRMPCYGFPNQVYDLEDRDVLGTKLSVLVSEKLGFFREWEQVYDFDQSSKVDRHFTFHEETGLLRFGDGIHGRSPDGEIRIVDYVRSLGRNGNVKAESMNKTIQSIPWIGEITNYQDAVLGRDVETYEDCFIRAKKEMKEKNRAVTDRDYETFVYQTPGLMVEACKVVPTKVEGNTITIAVKPYSLQPFAKVSEVYRFNIRSYLEGKRMIGTKIEITSPEYIHASVFVEVKIHAHFQDADAITRKTIKEYFDKSFHDFGTTISLYRLYGVLERLDCVREVASLTIDAKGNGIVRKANGDVTLPPNGIATLTEIQCVCKG